MTENKAKKDLEATIKEKVTPLLEETLEKSFGVMIPKLESDITDKLAQPSLHVYVPLIASYKQAKKKFKLDFLRRELLLKRGNVSQLAKMLGVDRRSVHRAIKEFDIDVDMLRGVEEGELHYKEQVVDQTIRGALEHYKSIFHPQKMEDMYKEVPVLSKNIAKVLPLEQLSWKEAEREFERQFFGHHVEAEKGNLKVAAKELGLRVETLQRKMKKLGMRT